MKNPKGIKVAQYLCLFPGVFLIMSGAMLLMTSEIAKIVFDLEDIDNPLALGMGVRQLVIGTLIVMFALTRQLKALGLVMVIGAIIPMTDFFIFSPSIGWMSALRYLLAVPLVLGLGFYLLHPLNNHHNE